MESVERSCDAVEMKIEVKGSEGRSCLPVRSRDFPIFSQSGQI